MKLGDKIRSLRYAEGMLRGLGREITQSELARAARQEVGKGISQSYLSQIENGARPHMTKSTRELLARFFKIHPGFLVDDPEGFHNELISSLPRRPRRLEDWLFEGAGRFRRDPELSTVLENLAHREDARRCLILLGAILDAPGLAPRLLHVLRPGHAEPRGESGVSKAPARWTKSESPDSRRRPRPQERG
ncbi:MAG TPA: helix-turn-helix transcriptional regulator [Terriglobales bacterium]|nr:helix-turn-helix transcriptional regulator [Terriglobales bacterium]